MKNLTIIILGNNINIDNNDIDILYSNGINIKEKILSVKTKYVCFIKDDDNIKEDYLDKVIEKSKEDFDCCFINYIVNYNYKNKLKILSDENILKDNYPYVGNYLWCFIYKKDYLIDVLNQPFDSNINLYIQNKFKNRTAIKEVLYNHNPNGKKYINSFYYCDIKKEEYYKNIIYIGKGCNGTFNGYITWINNIGKCFSNNYDITFLYDYSIDKTINKFSKYIRCVRRQTNTNYICERLLTTYSDYYYPKNIIVLDKSYLFIHGDMNYYVNSIKYTNDIYTKYIAVSKTCAKNAIGYFPTDNIEYILNPLKIDKNEVKSHLKLVSTLRYSEIKGPERIEIFAKILDELDIPYTWNVFTDKFENTNKKGLIYREYIDNVLPYVKDADYLVLLSNSEAFSYSVLEALSLNTKVIITPLDVYKENKIKDKEHGYIIPFEYFNEDNKDKLINIIKEIYINKDKKINYIYNESNYNKYENIFIN